MVVNRGAPKLSKCLERTKKKKNAFHLEWKIEKCLERNNKKQYFSCISVIPWNLSPVYLVIIFDFFKIDYKPIHYFAELIFCFKNYVSYRCFKRILTAINLKHKINRPRINNKILRYDFFLVINKFFLLFLSKFYYLFD